MKSIYVCVLSLFILPPLHGGVFLSSGSSSFEPFIVVHPPGYAGTGGQLTVRICANTTSQTVVPAAREAIEVWNNLSPTQMNCTGCRLFEDPPSGSTGPVNQKSVLIHEMGHCVMGLEHVNWPGTSFTNSRDAVTINAGTDTVRGSSDDLPSPLPGTRLIHWFRIADNDPFVIDSTVIDDDTFTRRIIDLPTGHTWPASGNRDVASLLGVPDFTQSVMYSAIAREQVYSGLSADDVNTVRLGMTGLDLQAGIGGDDYTIALEYTNDCAIAEVEVDFLDLGPANTLVPGNCVVDLDLIPTGALEIHHVLVPAPGKPRVLIQINTATFWDVLFADGFEAGDLSGWSGQSP